MHREDDGGHDAANHGDDEMPDEDDNQRSEQRGDNGAHREDVGSVDGEYGDEVRAKSRQMKVA
jgi:hypothetical protein